MGSSLPRWIVCSLALGSVGLAACGLVWGPGDYGDSRVEPGADSGANDADLGDSDVGQDAGPAVPEGGAGIIVLAARRDSVGSGDTTAVYETMLTTISASGELGPWSFDRTPPDAISFGAVIADGGQIYAQQAYGLAVAPIDGRLTGPWRRVAQAPARPGSYDPAWLLSEGSMISAGGYENDGGVTPTIWSTRVYAARVLLDELKVGPWELLGASRLVRPRGNVLVARVGGHAYAIGGRVGFSSSTDDASEVEVAPLDAEGMPGEFVATSPMKDAVGAPAGVTLPAVTSAGGYLFVTGGSVGLTGGKSDRVLAAKIDPANGMLGAWSAGPILPTPLTGHGVLFHGGRLFVFGGSTMSGATDAVRSVSFSMADGKFGAAWELAGQMPAPRYDLGVAVYR